MRRVAAFSLIALCSCATPPPSADVRAERMRAELHKDPGSSRAEDAERTLATLEYDRACRLHTVLAYKRFLEQFPRAAQADDVQARLEALRFNAARERGSAAALRQFLLEHPTGAHAEEARALLAKAELNEVPEGAEAKLKRLAEANEGTATGAEAADRLDDAAFARAQSEGALGLRQYLRDFAAGRHREQAQLQLLSVSLDSLLFAGDLIAAREEAARNPLARKLTDLEARFDAADRARAVFETKAAEARAALASHYLRPIEDLRRALSAPDPLDRWQAAEELGEHVSPRALDPLLDAIRSGRNPLIRQRALESLLKVAAALPRHIAEYELTARAEALAVLGETPETTLLRAVLAEARGDPDAAAALFQKALDPAVPDPLLLRRAVFHRQRQAQTFSSAVAARQLSVWALETAKANDPASPDFGALWSSRALCAAVAEARFAEDAIAQARAKVTDFPEDLEAFRLTALEARRLAEARLADAERALQREDRHALGCADRRVAERVEEAARLRLTALEKARARLPDLAPTLLRLASERDPSAAVRARARALLEGSRG